MWRGSLFGAALVVQVAFVVAFVALAGVPAGAFLAYVSNEKSNTISVIDTDKLAVVKTIKVGQRPRGIELTKDGKFILVAAGDDDTIR
jgi:YVTN family beta-propeller protein